MSTEEPWAWLKEIEDNWNHPAINTHNNPNRDLANKMIKAIHLMRSALEDVTNPDHCQWVNGVRQEVFFGDPKSVARSVLDKLSKGEFE